MEETYQLTTHIGKMLNVIRNKENVNKNVSY